MWLTVFSSMAAEGFQIELDLLRAFPGHELFQSFQSEVRCPFRNYIVCVTRAPETWHGCVRVFACLPNV